MEAIDYLHVDENSRVPKYQQLVNCVVHNISQGNFCIGDKIPSINEVSEDLYLSRDTVEKAYRILKKRKVITSVRGKGYYITRTKLISKINVLFLINKLSSYKMRIYNSFIDSIGGNAHTDLHIYHCDEAVFLSLIAKNQGAYDFYVIMPHFKTEDLRHISYTENVVKALMGIPDEKLVILDNSRIPLHKVGVQVYQDFENDIYHALVEGLPKIRKYIKLILAYPEKTVYPYPKRILHGFRKFCVEFDLDFEILDKVYEDIILRPGDLFIVIEEEDLVNLVKQIREEGLIKGDEIGIISYNDTPLKELLGITVISTDFKAMGETVANMILDKQQGKVKNPFHFIDRESL